MLRPLSFALVVLFLLLPQSTSLAFHSISKHATRRDLLSVLALGGFATRTLADDTQSEAKAQQAGKARQDAAMKARIAASKQNYRKTNTLMDQRKGVDYSCVAETGSPCKDKDSKSATPPGMFEDL